MQQSGKGFQTLILPAARREKPASMADPICVVIPSWPHGSMEKTSQTDWRRERSLLEAGSLIGDGFPRQLIQAEVGL